MKSFEYYSTKTIDEAVTLLHRFKPNTMLLAGGTDLIVKARKTQINPSILIDISKIEEMNYIKLIDKNIHIGAVTKLNEITQSEIVMKYAKILANAANQVGSIQIRNMATIGGNVGNASPSGDTITPLMVLNAKAIVAMKEGEREILVSDLFKGPGITSLTSSEMIKGFIIPCSSNIGTGMEFLKFTRRKGMDISVVNCATMLNINKINKTIIHINIALGAVAPIPILLQDVRLKLQGKVIDMKQCQEITKDALDQISPITDVRSSKKYRIHIVSILIERCIMSAYQNALSNAK